MLLVILGLVAWVALGVILASRYKGKMADKLHLAAGYSIFFMTLGVIITIALMRML